MLHRAGHTEAGCDLARLAGLEPASVIVEIIKPDGEMARRDDLEVFAKEHGLKIGTIADLIQYRMATEQTVSEVEHFAIQTEHGDFTAYRFSEFGSDDTHLAFVKGKPTGGVSTVRVHSFSPMKDLFGIHTSGSRWNIQNALAKIATAEHGVLVWIGHDDTLNLGDGFEALKDKQSVTSVNRRAPYQTIGVGAQILKHLGVKDMRLLSSPIKFNALSGFDLNVVETIDK